MVKGLKTKKELAELAYAFASGHRLVRYQSTTYIPADFETMESEPLPPPERTVWRPLLRAEIQLWGGDRFDILFPSEAELSSFEFMVAQNSVQAPPYAGTLLVRTTEGLKELNDRGELCDPTGEFRPNYLLPMLNTNESDKEKTFDAVAEWLDSDEEAESLLSHLATALAPGWSAVKYILLLGEGRNGKSVFLKMVQSLFGSHNSSTVTRQQIAEGSAVVTELNGKLVNLVFDGMSEYLKDSGREKSLIAGEPVPIRKLYESTPTIVESNALFLEGLNQEPKSKDKSTALQKRLVRFQFPNVYELDHAFERSMLKEATLGAFLSLLIDRYVREDDVSQRLTPTKKATALQLEHMYINSIGMQFLKYVEENEVTGTTGLLGLTLDEVATQFKSWRLKENDLGTWANPDVQELLRPLINSERRSMRTPAGPRKLRVLTSFKAEAAAFIETLEGSEEQDDALLQSLVDDG